MFDRSPQGGCLDVDHDPVVARRQRLDDDCRAVRDRQRISGRQAVQVVRRERVAEQRRLRPIAVFEAGHGDTVNGDRLCGVPEERLVACSGAGAQLRLGRAEERRRLDVRALVSEALDEDAGARGDRARTRRSPRMRNGRQEPDRAALVGAAELSRFVEERVGGRRDLDEPFEPPRLPFAVARPEGVCVRREDVGLLC